MRFSTILASFCLGFLAPVVVSAQSLDSDSDYREGFYSGFFVGYNDINANNSYKASDSGARETKSRIINSKSSGGIAGAFTFGYDFGPVWSLGSVRSGLEFGFRHNGADSIRLHTDAGDYELPKISKDTLSAMVDVVNDFNPYSLFDPYLGGGFGAAWANFEHNYSSFGYHRYLADRSSAAFAWQAIAGIRSYLMPTLALDLSYRYFRTREPSNLAPRHSGKERYASNTFMLGLTYSY